MHGRAAKESGLAWPGHGEDRAGLLRRPDAFFFFFFSLSPPPVSAELRKWRHEHEEKLSYSLFHDRPAASDLWISVHSSASRRGSSSLSMPTPAIQAGVLRSCGARRCARPALHPRRRTLCLTAAKKPGFGDELLDFVLGMKMACAWVPWACVD